jgi:predicted GNAT family acetyltransferase
VLENSAPEAAAAFALDIPEAADVRTVHGEHATCEAFALRWCARAGQAYREAMHLRHHRLTAVAAVAPAPGVARRADERDLAWLTRRSIDFADEAGVPDPRDLIVESVRKRLAQGRYRIWDDDAAVAFAAWSEAGAGAARITTVYTVAGKRGRGYGTSLTAALSRELLDAGYRELFLLTDVANPTANAIYARVGYRPVSDTFRFDFRPALGAPA